MTLGISLLPLAIIVPNLGRVCVWQQEGRAGNNDNNNDNNNWLHC